MGEIENLGGWGDGLDGTFELTDIRVAQAEIGKEGNEAGHGSGRLAPDQDGEKRKDEGEKSEHGYF